MVGGQGALLWAFWDRLARDLVDVELTVYYRIYMDQKELENEDNRAEKAD